MKIDKQLREDYEGNIRCDLCGRELKEDETVDVIQEGMFIEEDSDETTHVQYGENQTQTVLCVNCTKKVEIKVRD